jgi:hypothetical protein
MPTWQSIFSQNVQQFYLLVHSLHLLNAHLVELFRILSDSGSSLRTHNRVLPQCTTVHMLNAHLAELYRTHNRFLSATVSLIHSLASKVFNNLEVFLELLISAIVPTARLRLNSVVFKNAPLCTAIRTHSVLSHPPGVKPQRLLKPEIKNSCKCLTYIYNIIEHSQTFIQHRIHAGKTSSTYIKMENACLYKVFLSTACNKVSTPSFLLYSQILSLLSTLFHPPLQNEINKSLLPEGALRVLPSNLPTLFNYIEWVV